MSANNVDIARRMFRSVEDRDLQSLLDVYADDIVIRDADSLPYGGTYVGRQGAIDHAAGYLTTWGPVQGPGDRGLNPRYFDAGKCVLVLWRQRASHLDQKLDLPAISLIEMSAGKAARLEMFHFDTAALVAFLTAAGHP